MSKTLTDSEIIAQCDNGVKHRRFVELAIVHRLIQDLTAAGYELSYNDGEEAFNNQTEQQGVNVIFSVDDAHIVTRKNKSDNWISLVVGNGVDIISDYGMSLDDLIVSIYEWIDEQETAGIF